MGAFSIQVAFVFITEREETGYATQYFVLLIKPLKTTKKILSMLHSMLRVLDHQQHNLIYRLILILMQGN